MTETSGRWDRRNFLLNTVEGALYVTGTSLISAQTVMPALVFRLGGGNDLLAALSIITWAGVYLPQIFASRYGQNLAWKKPWVVWFGLLQRIFILLIGVVLFTSSPASKSTALVLFLLLFTLNQVTVGVTSPVWFDFYAKLIRRQFRGRSMGARTALAGVMSLGATVLLSYILSAYAFPTNFAILFVIAFVFEFVSIILQWLLVEEYPSAVSAQRSLPVYLRDVLALLRGNRDFRRFLIAVGIIILGTLPLGFFTIYAITRFHLDERSAGEFTLLMVVGQIFGALVVGYLADRAGNKTALIATASALLLASTAALAAPSLDIYRLVFVTLGIFLGSEMMIRYNLAIEYGPTELRSTYIGIMNTLLAPCYAIALCGSWIIATWGYTILFLLGALFTLGGLLYLIAFVREPQPPHHIKPALARPEESVIPEEKI
jgi:MFS family permease